MRAISLVAYFLFIFGCGHQGSDSYGITEQVKLQVDTSNIVIVPIGSVNWMFENAKFAELSNSEIYLIEDLIIQELKEYNKNKQIEYDSLSKNLPDIELELSDFIIDLDKYKRQYVPMISSIGEKEVWINCFCGDWDISNRQKLVIVDDGGNCYFNILINLSRNKVIYISVNGNA